MDVLSQLGIDISIVYQFFTFVGVWVFLKAMFFKPMMVYLKKREAKTTLLAEQISEMKAKLGQRRQVYENGRADIFRQAGETLDRYRKEGTQLHQDMLVGGHVEALKIQSEGRATLRKECAILKEELILRLNEAKKGLKVLWN